MPVLIMFLMVGMMFVIMGIISVWAVHCERRDQTRAEETEKKAAAAKA